MGQIDIDVEYAWEHFGGAWWGVLTVSRGSPAHHSGIAWPCGDGPGDDGGVMEALVIAAGDGATALADALGDIPAGNTGPFPGVSGAAWWSTLPAAVKAAVVDAGAAWADSGRMP